MNATELDELKREVRKLIGQGDIPAALAMLKKALPESVAKFSLAFQLFTRYNRASNEKTQGVLSYEQAELVFNRITADFLELLSGLEPRDFQAEGNASRSGQILYKVPKEMKVGREERCIVRLAFEESVIIERIELAGAVIKPIRLSKVMEVEMLDPNGEPAFAIRPLNSAEQFVEKGDFSEWIFVVTPLRIGELPLLLKVTVVESVEGRERKKEIVLEETIQVLAEGEPAEAPPPPQDFQASGYFFTASAATAPVGPPPPEKKLRAAYFYVSRVAAALAFLLVLGAGAWALGGGDYLAWYQARQEDSAASYEQYLAQRPQGRYRDQALARLDRLHWEDILTEPDDSLRLLVYLEEFPQGAYRADVQLRLEELRQEQQAGDTTLLEGDPPLLDSLPPADSRPAQTPSTTRPRTSRPSASRPTPSAPQPPRPPAETPQPQPQPGPTDPVPADSPDQAPTPPQDEAPARRSGFEMVAIKGGAFTMGSAKGDRDECPHQVSVQDFKIGRYAVTQADWREVMGRNPAYFSGCDECPVEQVSWNDAKEFIRRANEMKGTRYRLPTEAEWEYAARAGTDDRFAGGNGIHRFGWHHGNAQRVQRVGTKQANAWGLYDMTGNVWEWCQDLYEPYPDCRGSASNRRVLRGGSWRNREADCRTTARKAERPGFKDYTTGLRLAHP
jgi:formylglycine-generating enzyme required for sulfatase activity